MKRYSYDVTGRFTGEVECQTDQINGGYLIPHNSTEIPPPSAEDGHYVAFCNGNWEQIPYSMLHN